MKWYSRTGACLALTSCLMLCAAPCGANGMFVSHEQQVIEQAGSSGASAAQTGIVLRDGGHEVLLLRTTYRGPAEDFAWVVPVPRAPDESDGVFTASAEFFDAALQQSRPVLQIDPSQMHAGRAVSDDEAPTRVGDVEVISRRQVGEYDASVLSARSAAGLTEWLTRNGYKVPSNAGPVVADYVRRKWVFVAMRVLDWDREKKPVIDSVTPIGIRFPTESLVFPLAISKVSAPEKTSVLLLVYDTGPVRCRELPIRYAPAETTVKCGDSYERLRGRLARDPEPALVCETLGPGFATPRGSYRQAKGSHGIDAVAAQKLWLSRLWARIDRDDMVDLTFEADPEPREPYRLLINISAPGVVASGMPAASMKTSAVASASDTAPPRQGPSPVAYAAIPLSLVLLVLAVRGRRGLGIGAVMAAVALASLHAYAATGGKGRPEWVTQLGQAQEAIEKAVAAFAADTGSYPASLDDLTRSQQVTEGQDASGNKVRLLAPLSKVHLTALPEDPLTKRSDTWLFAVAGAAVVQSGGLEGVVERRAARARGWNDPSQGVDPRAKTGSRSEPDRLDSAADSRSFWKSRAAREKRFVAIETARGEPWGVVAVGKDETAVLLGSGMTTPTTGPDAPQPGYVRAVEGWGIREAAGGAHELMRLAPAAGSQKPPELELSNVSPEALVLGFARWAIVVRLGDSPALMMVEGWPKHSTSELLPLPSAMRVTQCVGLGYQPMAESIAVVLEPRKGVGLGEVWRIDGLAAVVQKGTRPSATLLARFYCDPGRTRLTLPAKTDEGLAAVWVLPDSSRAAVRATDLSGRSARWLPVTSLAPAKGWDMRGYETARRWIREHAADSKVPVLPL